MARDTVSAYVALGANLGQAPRNLAAAVQAIAALPLTQLLRCSRLYCSAPVDASGPDFYNAVIAIDTQLAAPLLLQQLQAIELAAGRERPWRNAPRTLDLDLLLYGAATLLSPALTLPHPRMAERAFVLLPLADVAPHALLPTPRADLAQQRIAAVTDPDWPAPLP